MSYVCITLNMLPKYKVFNSNHKILKSLMSQKVFIYFLSFLTSSENVLKSLIPKKKGNLYIFFLIHYINSFIKYWNKVSQFHNTYSMYLTTFLNILYFLTSYRNVLKSSIHNKIRKYLHISSSSSLLSLIDKVEIILYTQYILHVFDNFP